MMFIDVLIICALLYSIWSVVSGYIDVCVVMKTKTMKVGDTYTYKFHIAFGLYYISEVDKLEDNYISFRSHYVVV